MKSKILNTLYLAGMIFGLLMAAYPFAASLWNSHRQAIVTGDYTQTTQQMSLEQRTAQWNKVNTYNNQLFINQGALTEEMKEDYPTLLDPAGTGVIGKLCIPVIDVELPIYHGTDDDVLALGVGQIESTSLPQGGINRHVVLSGHRGLPGSKLLTDLNFVKTGDLFYIQVLDKTLYYRTDNIQVVHPEDESVLEIVPNEDKVSIITCTPYGLNTHRLVVTGSRIDEQQAEAISIRPEARIYKWIRPVGLSVSFLIFIGICLYIRKRSKTKRGANS